MNVFQRISSYVDEKAKQNGLYGLFWSILGDVVGTSLYQNFMEKFREKFPRLAYTIGFMDGPLEESLVDEIIYIVNKNDIKDGIVKKVDVFLRKYNSNSKPLYYYKGYKGDIDELLKRDNEGSFEKIGGYLVTRDFEALFDDDFIILGSKDRLSRIFGSIEGSLPAYTEEIIKDELRLKFKYATKIVEDKEKIVYVADPKKLPIHQAAYFLTQSWFLDKANTVYKWIEKKIGTKMPKTKRRSDAVIANIYRRFTNVVNKVWGLPEEIVYNTS